MTTKTYSGSCGLSLRKSESLLPKLKFADISKVEAVKALRQIQRAINSKELSDSDAYVEISSILYELEA